MHLGVPFYLSLLGLGSGIIGGIYFFIEWLLERKKSRFLLFWSGALFCLFIFQIPTVIANAGIVFTLSKINTFFAGTFALAFLALIAENLGILDLAGVLSGRIFFRLTIWFAIAVLYFNYYFQPGKVFTSHLPLYGILLLFFLPVHFLNIAALYILHARTKKLNPGLYNWGIGIILFSLICGIARNAILLWGFKTYPPKLWFLALQNPTFFAFQIIGTLALLGGFILIRRENFRIEV